MSGTVVARCLDMVRPAENAFRARWKLSTLARVNADLHAALVEQINLYDVALITGSDADCVLQAEAMVRGWKAACTALESPLRPDDAYMLGFDGNTGTRVVIAERQASSARVQRLEGERVLFVTPDEVAKLMGGMELLVEAKRLFPDAEVISPGEAA